MNKKIIAAIIIVILGFVISQIIFKKDEDEYTLSEAKINNIVQEVSETGVVKKGEEINLSFENTGRISEIYVSEGDTVKAGQALARLETRKTQIQLQEANAALELAQAEFNRLLAGASAEEIEVARTTVDNAQTSLENAIQSLENVKTIAQENLEQSYEDALNSLDGSYLKIYNAFNEVDSLQRTYFSSNDQKSTTVKEKELTIKNAMLSAAPYVDDAKNDPSQENIDKALIEIRSALDKVYDSLEIIRETCEEISYRDTVSATDKAALDTHKTNINTSLTSIISAQQAITSARSTNGSNINTAETAVASAQGTLRSAQNNMALTIAVPQQADIDLYQAKVQRAQANISLLQNQIGKATLFCPVDGQVTEADKKAGELAHLTDTIVALLPAVPFEIETDIYEEDVVKINIGNPVDISLIAFPDQIFKGEVASIAPAEKLMDGVVYYKITITFHTPISSGTVEKIPEGVKPGMTADLIIQTAQKENVLIIDEEGVQEKDDKIFVEVLKDGKIEEREIETGLLGSDDMIEIISGLEAGEKVILR